MIKTTVHCYDPDASSAYTGFQPSSLGVGRMGGGEGSILRDLGIEDNVGWPWFAEQTSPWTDSH